MTFSLKDLGWSTFFEQQRSADPEPTDAAARVAEVHRDRLTVFSPSGTLTLSLPPDMSAGSCAVGDWVLHDRKHLVCRLLERQSLLSRRAAGSDARVQLIAANVDTLFITSSCNADFNAARIERYLALAHEAGSFPVLLLTKADQADAPDDYVRQAQALSPALPVLAINAHDPGDMAQVAEWCKPGQTAALLGSSGVGKSTVMNGLTGGASRTAQIREDDAKGRHTTTARTLRAMTNGGWIIDTPGMRALRLHDVTAGIETLFADIEELAAECRFNDCAHGGEPGCAVQAALADGSLDPDRMDRWIKLKSEDSRNSETLAESRRRQKGFGKMVRAVQKGKQDRKRY